MYQKYLSKDEASLFVQQQGVSTVFGQHQGTKQTTHFSLFLIQGCGLYP